MKTTNSKGGSTPTANLTVNKNRLKMYEPIAGTEENSITSEPMGHSGGIYYLEDGQNFELELFNPTKQKLKAKILFGGNDISGGGVVLFPGERIYLERYIDDNNKFLFETYDVDITNNEVKEAISMNGKIEISFYREVVVGNRWDDKPNLWWPNYPNVGGTGTPNITNFPTISPNQPTFIPHFPPTIQYYDSCGTSSSGSVDCVFTTTSSQGFYDNNAERTLSANVFETPPSDKMYETGMVGRGDKSEQEFTPINADFGYFPTETVKFQIKPTSNKPIYKADTQNKYCFNCGSKVKSNFKFCPVCGEKQ